MATSRRNVLIDAVFVTGAVLFSLFYFLGRWRGAIPFVDLTGDAANIASYLAAADHPTQFARDPFLGNPDNYSFYFAAIMPVVRALARMTGDYGSAFTFLLPVHVFTQIVGFYMLGLALMNDRLFAAILAVATSALSLIWMAGGEAWGLFLDAIPRFTFQAFMPYLFLAAHRWQSSPNRWPLLMVLAGVATYLHTPSGPVFGFSVWCGLWAFMPDTWRSARKIGYMLLLGIVFLVLISPFAIHYFGSTGTPLSQVDFDAKLEEFRTRSAHYSNLSSYFTTFLDLVVRYELILPSAVVGTIILVKLRTDARVFVRFLLMWVLGVITVSVVVTLVDRMVAQSLGRLPVLTLFVRSLRYLIPVMLLFCVWPLAAIHQRLESRAGRWIVAGVALLLLGLFAHSHRPTMFMRGVSCLIETRGFVCPSEHQEDRLGVLDAIRKRTPPGSTFLTLKDDLAIRYYAMRPLVFTWKNVIRSPRPGGVGVAEWSERGRSLTAAKRAWGKVRKVALLVSYSRAWDSDYLMVPFKPSRKIISELASLDAEVIYSNRSYILIDVRRAKDD